MKKILSIFLIGFIAVGILIPTHFASAVGVADVLDYTTGFALAPVILPIIVVITTLCSFLLIITGQLLDLVVQWSIFDMASIIGSGSAIGRAVLDSWGAIRDLANIFFIFILLYAAFSAMFNFSFGSFGKTVVNIIIVALLINFSMFFTKVVIDASNIVTTGFYQIISESNKEVVVNNQVQGNIMGIGSGRYTNLSAAYMRVLNIQTVFGTFDISMFRSTRMIIYGIFGSSIMLILALILFSIAMMLITRFIVLIYLMVLSPAAILCIALPKMRTYFDKWLSSLLSQAFFAPVFFALLWIALRIGSEVNVAIRAGNTGKFEFTNIMSEDPTSGVAVLFSYILILGMTLAAMRAAKSIASGAAGFTTVNAFIGGAAIGMTSAGLRNSVGRWGNTVSKDRDLAERAASGKAGAWIKFNAANLAASSSFDVRNVETLKKSGLDSGLDMFGKGGGKGGYQKIIDEKSKAKAEYAKKVYGGERPGDKDADDAAKKIMEREVATLKKQAEEEQKEKRKLTAAEAKSVSDKKNKEAKRYEENALRKEMDEFKKLKDARKKELDNAKNAKTDDERKRFTDKADILAKNIEIAKESLDERRKDMSENDAEYIARREAAEEAKKEYDDKKKAIKADVKESEYSETIAKKIKEVKEGYKSSSQKRQEQYANRISSGIFGWRAVNKVAADKIKKQIKEKTKEKKLEDVMKEYAKEEQTQTQTPTTPPDANPPANPTT